MKERKYTNAGSGGKNYSTLVLSDLRGSADEDRAVVQLSVSSKEEWHRDVQLTETQTRDLITQLTALVGDDDMIEGGDFTK